MQTPKNTIALADIAAANALLVSFGAEDQMPRIAAASIERTIEQQNRIDRALAYADALPANAAHARQMARILDGSITIDDEQNEVDTYGIGEPRRTPARELHAPRPAAPKPAGKGPRGKLKPGAGLTGRSTKERLAMREWIAQQGIEISPTGRIPQEYIDQYDRAQEAIREHRRQERKRQKENGETLL
jgi:hypothetical protein